MKRLTCEMCGSNDFAKVDGFMVCQSCGTKYSIEEAKKLMVEVEGTVSVQGTVQIDKTSEVQKHLVNARRALAKEDWDDVVRYYNLVEENDPTDIEAIFYSTYGKAKQTLTSDDFYKREQVFKSLIKSISIIDDNFNLAKEQEQKEIIIKIHKAILDMASSAYVYTEVRNGYGELKSDNSVKTRQLFNDLQYEFVIVITNIIAKYDDESKIGYLCAIIIEQSDYILEIGQLAKVDNFVAIRIDAARILKNVEPTHPLANTDTLLNSVSENFVFKGEDGQKVDVYLFKNGYLVFSKALKCNSTYFNFVADGRNPDVVVFSAKDLYDSISLELKAVSVSTTNGTEEMLQLSVSSGKKSNLVELRVHKENYKSIRKLFDDICHCGLRYKIKGEDNVFLTESNNSQSSVFCKPTAENIIDKNAVMGLSQESVTVRPVEKDHLYSITLNPNGSVKLTTYTCDWVWQSDQTFYFWDIVNIVANETSLTIMSVNDSGKRETGSIRYSPFYERDIYTIVKELEKRIIACGNKTCDTMLNGLNDGPSCIYLFPLNIFPHDGKHNKLVFEVVVLHDRVEISKSTYFKGESSTTEKTVSYQSFAGLQNAGENSVYVRYKLDGSLCSMIDVQAFGDGVLTEGVYVDKEYIPRLNTMLYNLAEKANRYKQLHYNITFYSQRELDEIKQKGISALPKRKGPCYVATAVYGSYDCPQVWTLRRYRDEVLGSTWYGRLFIKLYYAISPTLVKWFGKTKWFQKMWKGKLDKMVGKLNAKGFDDTPYQDKDWR